MNKQKFLALLALVGYTPIRINQADRVWGAWTHPTLPTVYTAWFNNCIVKGWTENSFPRFEEAWAYILEISNVK